MAEPAHNPARSPNEIEELDARVDALVQEVAQASESAVATLSEPAVPAVGEVGETEGAAAADSVAGTDSAADDLDDAAFDLADFQDATTILSGENPKTAPIPQAPVVAELPHRIEANAPVASLPAADTPRQTQAQPEPDLEPQDADAQRDAQMVAALESAANQAPVADIEQLDAALAAGAEKALHDAQKEIQDAAPAAPAPPPAPAEPAPSLPAPASGPQAPTPEPAVAPLPAAPAQTASPAHLADTPAPRRTFGALLAPVLEPLAAMHIRLGEPARQTVGYVAVMTFFSGAVIWGFIALSEQRTAQPTSTPRYVQTSDAPEHAESGAHQSTSEHAKPEPSGSHDAHAPASDGHGEAKKPAAKKAPSKKPAEKAAPKKSGAKKDDHAASHGGH